MNTPEIENWQENCGPLPAALVYDVLKVNPYSLLLTPYCLLPTPYSLLPTPYSLLPYVQLQQLPQANRPLLAQAGQRSPALYF